MFSEAKIERDTEGTEVEGGDESDNSANSSSDIVDTGDDDDAADADDIPSTTTPLLKSAAGGESAPAPVRASKREMMSFALPALGIFLTNPLLSNIDNAFVGRMSGTSGLAALSPGTLCTDQMLYLFSFLGRATTGLVTRAYGGSGSEDGDVDKAREAAAAPLTVSLFCGLVLSFVYVAITPRLLAGLKVDPVLRPDAASYIYWRGAITWAALAQNVSLQVMLATRDAVTPLKIVTAAAMFNVMGDALLCVWPFQFGVPGAAAATAAATLVSSGFMLKALARKRLLPSLRLPNKKESRSLLEFMGPILGITVVRLLGFLAMQRRAMALGVTPLAAYQLCINVVMFFLLFGEPLSQLSQTTLPSLLDAEDGDSVFANLKSIGSVALGSSLFIGGLAYSSVKFGAGIFSSDPAVQMAAHAAAPVIFLNVAIAVFCVAIDGAMLASKDFGFMLIVGLTTFTLQSNLLQFCTSLSGIFATFTLRLGMYSVLCMGRAAIGKGPLGRVLYKRKAVGYS